MATEPRVFTRVHLPAQCGCGPSKLMTGTLMTKLPLQPQDSILISDSRLQELLILYGAVVSNTITEMRVRMYESQLCPYLPCCTDILKLKMYRYPFSVGSAHNDVCGGQGTTGEN